MTFVIGHIFQDDHCLSCGLQGEELPFEPCPDQKRARQLTEQGKASLPSSFEQFKSLVDWVRGS